MQHPAEQKPLPQTLAQMQQPTEVVSSHSARGLDFNCYDPTGAIFKDEIYLDAIFGAVVR